MALIWDDRTTSSSSVECDEMSRHLLTPENYLNLKEKGPDSVRTVEIAENGECRFKITDVIGLQDGLGHWVLERFWSYCRSDLLSLRWYFHHHSGHRSLSWNWCVPGPSWSSQQEMYDEILKQGSKIVDDLSSYKSVGLVFLSRRTSSRSRCVVTRSWPKKKKKRGSFFFMRALHISSVWCFALGHNIS